MTPQQIVASLQSFSPQQLNSMNHADLYNTRSYLPRGDDQNRVANAEHRAFAREATQESPWMAAPIAAAIPFYQVSKMLGNQSRSAPSLTQMGESYKGIGEGLWGAFQEAMTPTQNRTAGTSIDSSSTGLLGSLRNYLQGSSKDSTNRQ